MTSELTFEEIVDVLNKHRGRATHGAIEAHERRAFTFLESNPECAPRPGCVNQDSLQPTVTKPRRSIPSHKKDAVAGGASRGSAADAGKAVPLHYLCQRFRFTTMTLPLMLDPHRSIAWSLEMNSRDSTSTAGMSRSACAPPRDCSSIYTATSAPVRASRRSHGRRYRSTTSYAVGRPDAAISSLIRGAVCAAATAVPGFVVDAPPDAQATAKRMQSVSRDVRSTWTSVDDDTVPGRSIDVATAGPVYPARSTDRRLSAPSRGAT